MKKYIYIVLAVAFVALAGCNKKAKDEVRVYPESAAEKAVALGNFDGLWNCVEIESETANPNHRGTISFELCTVDSILAKAGEGNVVMVKAVCTDLVLNSVGVVNVMHAGDDIIFQNNKAEGGFGAAVFGRIQGAYTDNAKAVMTFRIAKKEGRLTKTFEYTFE